MLIEPLALLATALLQQVGEGAFPSGPPRSPLGYHDVRLEADRWFAGGNWRQAVDRYDKLAASVPWDGELWNRLGIGRYSLREYPAAIAAFERALAVGVGNTASTQYNLACCCALQGRRDDAFRWLDAALASRFEDRARFRADRDFESLHDDPRWATVAGMLPAGDQDHGSGWRFDLDFLVAEAKRMHAGPSRPAFSAEFARRAAALREAIPDLTNDRILTELMRLVAVLNDGHTAIYGPGPDTPLEFDGRVLPLVFYWFPSGLWIVDGAGDHAKLAGHRIVRFAGLEAGEVLRRMAEYRGVDNAMTWRWMGPQFYVRRLALLRAVGVASADGTVELTLEARDGVERQVVVPAGDHPQVRKLRPSPAATGEVARYQSAIDVNYWMEPLPDHSAVYLQFNKVRDAARESIAALATRLRDALADEDVTALIVDVRHNNGGNNSLVRPLVRAMVEFDNRSPAHRIYVLMGRNTFSAAQNFINRVERWTDAVFVGEPSSSSPNFVGEETEVVLPYSRVRGSISTHYWQDSDPGDDRGWIAPDVPVQLTAAAYFANTDPALDAVLKLLGRE